MPNNAFTPGKKANLRRMIKYQSVLNSKNTTETTECSCFADKKDNFNNNYNDSTQSENTRVSQILSSSLGGRITFGNRYIPYKTTFLGGIEGQPGGIPRPLRNKF
jgi:hypothetical protein